MFIHFDQIQTGLVSCSEVRPGSQQAWVWTEEEDGPKNNTVNSSCWRDTDALLGRAMRYCSVTQPCWLFDLWRHRSAGKQRSSAYTLRVDMACAIIVESDMLHLMNQWAFWAFSTLSFTFSFSFVFSSSCWDEFEVDVFQMWEELHRFVHLLKHFKWLNVHFGEDHF